MKITNVCPLKTLTTFGAYCHGLNLVVNIKVTDDIHQMRSFALTRLNTTEEKNPFKLAFV